MTATALVRLVVEVDPSAEPVAGVIRRDGRDAEAFAGWMALTQAIDLLLKESA